MCMLQVMKIAPAELRKRLFITICGEEALDYGGVAKLVLILTARGIIIVMKIHPLCLQ